MQLIVSVLEECGSRYNVDVSSMIEEYSSPRSGMSMVKNNNVKGRPKKEKRKIGLDSDSSDLFAELLANVSGESSESESEKIVEETLTCMVNRICESEEEVKKVEEPMKKSKKVAAKKVSVAPSQEELAAKEEKKKAELAEKEEKKKAELAAKEEAKAAKAAELEKKKAFYAKPEKQKKAPAAAAAAAAVQNSQADDEEEEVDTVKRFEFEGVKYLKSTNTGIIYNMEQDAIGKWNEKTQKIDFSEMEEEEEEYDE